MKSLLSLRGLQPARSILAARNWLTGTTSIASVACATTRPVGMWSSTTLQVCRHSGCCPCGRMASDARFRTTCPCRLRWQAERGLRGLRQPHGSSTSRALLPPLTDPSGFSALRPFGQSMRPTICSALMPHKIASDAHLCVNSEHPFCPGASITRLCSNPAEPNALVCSWCPLVATHNPNHGRRA